MLNEIKTDNLIFVGKSELVSVETSLEKKKCRRVRWTKFRRLRSLRVTFALYILLMSLRRHRPPRSPLQEHVLKWELVFSYLPHDPSPPCLFFNFHINKQIEKGTSNTHHRHGRTSLLVFEFHDNCSFQPRNSVLSLSHYKFKFHAQDSNNNFSLLLFFKSL